MSDGGSRSVRQHQRHPRSATIYSSFHPKRNSVNALRLALAGFVLVSHTLKLHGGEDPLAARTGGAVDMGTIAVDGFFALSGFLITASYLSSPSLWRYLWRRCLRILPGFWACLVVTAVVILPLAQLLQYGTMAGFPLTGSESVTSYVISNSALFIQQFYVRGLFDGMAVNGSLYTLFYEFACYLAVAAFGVLGLLHRRRWVVLAVAVTFWLVTLADLLAGGALISGSTTLSIFLRFGAMFFAGAVLQMWAKQIPLNARLAVAAAVVFATSVASAIAIGTDPAARLAYVLIAMPAVAYLVIFLGCSRRLARVGAKRDLSYGLYVYAWPIQALLILAGAEGWPLLAYLLSSLTISLLFALASWHAVESPALALKAWTPRWMARPEPGSAQPPEMVKIKRPESSAESG